MDYRLRIGDFEIMFDSEKDQHSWYPQLVKWEGNTNFTIASWEKGKEGYNFKSVGSRLFEYLIDADVSNKDFILKSCSTFDKILNEWFEKENE